MSWNLKEKLYQRYHEEEQPKLSKAGCRLEVALAFPNTYHVAMSNLGFQIMYREINSRKEVRCDRFFWPDRQDLAEYERTNTPLLSLERQLVLSHYQLVGFAVSFEMDYLQLLGMLTMGRVPLWSKDRSEQDPIVVVGGPCATFNPEPLAEFVDVFVIGEGEEVIHELLDAYESGWDRGIDRATLLLELAQIPGLYVPRFYEPTYQESGELQGYEVKAQVPSVITRRWVKQLGSRLAETELVTKDTEFKDMYLVEVARGCGRHCRFCMAGYCFRRPRVQALPQLKEAVDRAAVYRQKVGLVGAAISDYPEIDELCDYILSKGMTLSVASLRADTITPTLAAALAKSGQRTITLAPEAGSERLRRVINKGISNEHLQRAIDLAADVKIPHVRFYIMIGLPFETEEDIDAIITLAKNTMQDLILGGGRRKLTLSINPFVPKPFTPFQWLPMAPMKVVENRLKRIQKELKSEKNIEVLIESPKEAYVQGILARGDRRLAPLLAECAAAKSFKAFRKQLSCYGLSEDFYLYRQRQWEEVLPWDFLDMGLRPEYLREEFEKACREESTAPCRENCLRCGVCREG